MKPDLPIDTQILWLAAELVEKGHCKNALARRKDGYEADVHADDAVAWCVYGALKRASASQQINLSAYKRLYDKVGGPVVDWNNAPERTAAEVALALRTA